MQPRNPLFGGFAKMTELMGGLKEEVEAMVRQQIERIAGEMDLVTREEFDAVKAMAAKARAEQETLAARVEALEAQLGQKSGSKASTRKTATSKTSTRKAPAKKATATRKAPAKKAAAAKKAAPAKQASPTAGPAKPPASDETPGA